jgi:hypothetical protein
MSKQTAVEWLVEELFKKIDYIQVDPRIINQAKAMEREQIIEAAERWKGTNFAEQYYNETFGK